MAFNILILIISSLVISSTLQSSELNAQNFCSPKVKQLLIKLAKKPSANKKTRLYELNGWLDLIQILEPEQCKKNNLLLNLKNWSYQYSNHPANYFFPSFFGLEKSDIDKIALLLPLNEKYQKYSQHMIKTITHLAAKNNISIQIYDTNTILPSEAYQQAVNEQANCIIGPLLQKNINQIAQLEPNLPVLTLTPKKRETHSSAKFFSLSKLTSVEVESIVTTLDKKDYSKGILLYLEKKPFKNLALQVKKRYEQNFGQWVGISALNGRNSNYTKISQSILHIDKSLKRYQRVKTTINKPVEYIPRRRKDIDFIILLASATQIQQLYPQLKFWYADDIPVYGGSYLHPYLNMSSNKGMAIDLAGIIIPQPIWLTGKENIPSPTLNKFNLIAEQAFTIVLETNCMQLENIFMYPSGDNAWRFIPEKGLFILNN